MPKISAVYVNKQKSFIVQKETKVIYQQMVQLNQEMKYVPVLNKFWEENLDEEYTSITGIMVDMKDVLSLLEPNPIEYKKDPENNYLDNDLKCVYSLLDIDSYWMFQRTSTQRMMISLPSDSFYTFGQN